MIFKVAFQQKSTFSLTKISNFIANFGQVKLVSLAVFSVYTKIHFCVKVKLFHKSRNNQVKIVKTCVSHILSFLRTKIRPCGLEKCLKASTSHENLMIFST